MAKKQSMYNRSQFSMDKDDQRFLKILDRYYQSLKNNHNSRIKLPKLKVKNRTDTATKTKEGVRWNLNFQTVLDKLILHTL